ncbi:TPA_asm: oncoid [Terrapene box turtle adintovirus]|uniref:Oncoid n=1 Tax=Terrapene box turtle adintovirus TaxID=2597808 RepID=A0A5H3CIS4_9VIRU|nr:oncoid [Terrapene box turtle adintovirus]DAC80293.1 TPA_asm: oncoid [Terrapene box turtle adintovirus]
MRFCILSKYIGVGERGGLGNFSDNAVVRDTRTSPPELPTNQESALRPLTTQNSTRVQLKHPGGPNLIYVKPKDKTKDSGKKQPCHHNSSSSVATTTPSPEETVSENTHIHKPRARTLGVLNVRKPGACALGAAFKKPRTKSFCDAEVLQSHNQHSSSSAATTTPSPEETVSENAHIHKPGACALGVVNKKPRTDKPFSQNHKLVPAPPYSSSWEGVEASLRKVVEDVSSGRLKERDSRKKWEKYDAWFRAMLKNIRAGKGGSEQA